VLEALAIAGALLLWLLARGVAVAGAVVLCREAHLGAGNGSYAGSRAKGCGAQEGHWAHERHNVMFGEVWFVCGDGKLNLGRTVVV
jgi:hypothetical protein